MKFGKAFSDSLVVEHFKKRKLPNEDRAWWHGAGRALLFASIASLSFFVLFLRLVHLTVVRGHELRNFADGNRTQELIRHAPRGIIFDRTGKSLTINIPLAEQFDFVRTYPYGSSLAHLVGYTGEVSAQELKDDYYWTRGYAGGDRLGRTGAEAVFEEKLRGRNGKELVEVDAHGAPIRVLGIDPEVAGEPVTLSVDADLAKVVEDSFPKEHKGAVVVAKPATGEILALYSSPSFDPKSITETLLNDEASPLFFRAIGGVYPPGSTFKIVTATGALEEGAITKETTVEDNGVITIGPFTFPNWYFTQYGKTDGVVDIVKAIRRSNDIFFYKAGEWVGITKLANWAAKFGIGKPLGIELGGEAGGLMPDPRWKNSYFSSPEDIEGRNNLWYLGDTYHVAIGQGYLLTTPLQVNSWTNVIANSGKLCKPTIKKGTGECKDLEIKKETIDLVSEGMKKVCEPGGTGWPLFNFPVSVACKTGTAEFGDPDDKTHAWFTVFGPIEEPEISVTVLVEGGGEGSNVAAPVAKKILEAWFSR